MSDKLSNSLFARNVADMAGATENYPDEDDIPMDPDELMMKDIGKGRYRTIGGQAQGPQPVPGDDGLEHVLVHVISISGEWLWSEVLPEHMSMGNVQQLFENSDKERFGLVDGHRYRLMYEFGRDGPYPRGSDKPSLRAWPEYSVYSLRVHLGTVKGILRSTETREVWITAVRVRVI